MVAIYGFDCNDPGFGAGGPSLYTTSVNYGLAGLKLGEFIVAGSQQLGGPAQYSTTLDACEGGPPALRNDGRGHRRIDLRAACDADKP